MLTVDSDTFPRHSMGLPWDCRSIDPRSTTPHRFSAVRLAVPWSVWLDNSCTGYPSESPAVTLEKRSQLL